MSKIRRGGPCPNAQKAPRNLSRIPVILNRMKDLNVQSPTLTFSIPSPFST